MPSFDNQKRLRFVITLGTTRFDEKGRDQITLEGFRAVADINLAGGLQMGELRARIYGVKMSDMNAITSFALKTGTLEQNTVVVYAIDGTVETMVFAGNIIRAWPDFNNMPDVFLMIQAQAAGIDLIKAVSPRSFSGDIDVASVMSQIAYSMGYSFENNGVDIKLSDVYLDNTGLEQAKDLARIAGIDLYLDGKTLAITPKNTPRQQGNPIAAIDNTEKIKEVLAKWKIEHDKFLVLFKEGQALDNAGDSAGALKKYEEAKIYNTKAEILIAEAKSLKSQERPASVTGIPLVNKDTGMIGYPMFDGTYLTVRTLYNPAIISGGAIQVESSLDRANGVWQVMTISHRLEAEKPNGAWFSQMQCVADLQAITGRK